MKKPARKQSFPSNSIQFKSTKEHEGPSFVFGRTKSYAFRATQDAHGAKIDRWSSNTAGKNKKLEPWETKKERESSCQEKNLAR